MFFLAVAPSVKSIRVIKTSSRALLTLRSSFFVVFGRTSYVTVVRVCLCPSDAAHSMHPMAGQGLNLGLDDVTLLADSLEVAAQSGSDLGGYENARGCGSTQARTGVHVMNRTVNR